MGNRIGVDIVATGEGTVVGALDNISRSVGRMASDTRASAGRMAADLDSVTASVGRMAAGFAIGDIIANGLRSAFDFVKQFVNNSLDYLGKMESAGLGIASSFMTGGQYIDTTTGKVLQGQQSMKAAMADSAQVMEQLKVANMQTIATLDQLVVAYQQTLPVAMAKGFNRDQVMQFTQAMVQAAGAISLPFDQMAEETRSLLTGNINPRNSRIATVLGLRNEDINEYKNNAAGLFTFLMEKLDGYKLAGLEAQNSWAGLWSNFKDIMGQIGGQTFQPLFDAIKYELKTIIDYFVKIDETSKTIKWNPEFISSVESVRSTFTAIIAEVYRMNMLIDLAGGTLTAFASRALKVAEVFTRFMTIGQFGDSLKAGSEKMAEWNKMYADRYAQADKALQALADRETSTAKKVAAAYQANPPKPGDDAANSAAAAAKKATSDYEKYLSVLDKLNISINAHNPLLGQQANELEKVNIEIAQLIRENPLYADSIKDAGERLKQNIIFEKEHKEILAQNKQELAEYAAAAEAIKAMEKANAKQAIEDIEKEKTAREKYYQWLVAHDPLTGATAALKEYGMFAAQIGKQTGDMVADMFYGMEDALTSFIRTGKLSFTDMVNSMLDDMARMAVKQGITGPLSSLMNGAISSLFATGGPAIMGAIGTGAGPTLASAGGLLGGTSATGLAGMLGMSVKAGAAAGTQAGAAAGISGGMAALGPYAAVAAGALVAYSAGSAYFGKGGGWNDKTSSQKTNSAVMYAVVPGLGALDVLFGGSISRNVFGGGSKIDAQGLEIGAAGGDISANSYKIKHKDKGWGGTSHSTYRDELDDKFMTSLNEQYDTVINSVLLSSKTLGYDISESALAGFNSAVTRIDMKGLDAEGQQKALAEYFRNISNEAIKLLVPDIDSLTRLGEDATAAYERMMSLRLRNNSLLMKELDLLGKKGGSEYMELMNAQRSVELIAMDASTQAIQKRVWALEDEKTATEKFTTGISSALTSTLAILKTKASLLVGNASPQQGYEMLKKAFSASTRENVTDNAAAFLQASRAYYASGPQYQADFQSVIASLDNFSGMVGDLTDTQRQITLLEKIATAIAANDTVALTELGTQLETEALKTLTLTDDMKKAIAVVNEVFATPIIEGTAALQLTDNIALLQAALDAVDASGNKLISEPNAVGYITDAMGMMQTALDLIKLDPYPATDTISKAVSALNAAFAITIETKPQGGTQADTLTLLFSDLNAAFKIALYSQTAENVTSVLDNLNAALAIAVDPLGVTSHLGAVMQDINNILNGEGSLLRVLEAFATKANELKVTLPTGFIPTDSRYQAATGENIYGDANYNAIAIGAGISGVTTDQNVEAVKFAETLTSYVWKQMGNSLVATLGGLQIAQMYIPAAGLDLAFGDGSTAKAIFNKTSTGYNLSGLPGFARGGITSGLAFAGEIGPEAVIPLPDGRTVPVTIKGAADNRETVAELKETNRQLAASIRVLQAGFQQLIEQQAEGNQNGKVMAQKTSLKAAA